MFGKRDINAHGSEATYYGYILDGKFVFTDENFEFDLEGGDVVEFHSLQTGGFCMIDYIEMQDGSIYTLNDETIIKHLNKDTFVKSFEEQELDFFEAQMKGLLKTIDGLDGCGQRGKEDLVKQDEIYQAWILSLKEELGNAKKEVNIKDACESLCIESSLEDVEKAYAYENLYYVAMKDGTFYSCIGTESISSTEEEVHNFLTKHKGWC